MIFVETNRLFLRKVEEGDWPYFRVHLTDREKDRMMLQKPVYIIGGGRKAWVRLVP